MIAAPALAVGSPTAPPRRGAVRPRGVTLLELLIVLSIMGIVAAMVTEILVSTYAMMEMIARYQRAPVE